MTGLVAYRVLDGPIVWPALDPRIGGNINGPSLVEMPEWASDRVARYHLYFAHHTGRSIRLAVADHITGPWRMQSTDVLNVAETGFAQADVHWRMEDGTGVTDVPHIASPDVHIDNDAKRIRMYFHGVHGDGSQVTRLAVSPDGLRFTEASDDLGPCYLRVGRWGDRLLGVAWGGEVFLADDWSGPFRRGPGVLEDPNGSGLRPRHPVFVLRSGRLFALYTLIGDVPERIWIAEVDCTSDQWRLGQPRVLLSPEYPWEGGDLTPAASRIGAAWQKECALRDPHVWGDWLFYVGGGEQAIGVARLDWSAIDSPK